MPVNDINFKKILVPISLKKGEEVAVHQAMFLQKHYGSKITFLHVTQNSYETEEELDELEMFKESIRDNILSLSIDYRPQFDILVKKGEIVETIIKIQTRFKYDLIISKSTRHQNGVISTFKLRKTDLIISKAKCPVLTVKKEWTDRGIFDILIPIDITKPYDKIINRAAKVADMFKANLRIVSVLKDDSELRSKSINHKADDIYRRLKDRDIRSEIKLISAGSKPIYQAFVDYALTQRRDMIFISTKDASLIDDNYIGEFATEVIHRSKKPVLSMSIGNEVLMNALLNIFNS
ncbi:MAG: universal stress protein [Bacteroidales bacterium]|jgi:nucleotide-binding universal stress UspA family protein|nr:universal stress protein [Bacteroidales bacterium]